MIETMLGVTGAELQKIIPYEFMRWTSDRKDTYFVGEYAEIATDTEDGYGEYTLMVTGTTVESWLVLERYRAKIEDHFPKIGGLRVTTEKGVVVIFYENTFPVDTGDANLKRIQVNLHIKTWKGMN